jgi:hypothetical protein
MALPAVAATTVGVTTVGAVVVDRQVSSDKKRDLPAPPPVISLCTGITMPVVFKKADVGMVVSKTSPSRHFMAKATLLLGTII